MKYVGPSEEKEKRFFHGAIQMLNAPKENETQGFLYFWQSNRTICRLLSWFCAIIFPPSRSLYWGLPFLITPELRMRKRDSPKNGWDTGFLYFGQSNWTIYSLLNWFCSIIFPSTWPLYRGLPFLITQELKIRKWNSPKNGCDTGVSVLWAMELDRLQSVKLILFNNFSTTLIFTLGAPISYYPRAENGWCTLANRIGPFAEFLADFVQ